MKKEMIEDELRMPMLKRIAHFLILFYMLVFVCVSICKATPIRIIGEGQLELINLIDHTSHVVETASLVIVVDGSQYRISSKSIESEEMKDEFGSDGIDTFLVSDRHSPFNRDGKGWTGYAFSGRLPSDCSPIIQAAWLGYCSGNYFNSSSNRTGLALSYLVLPWSPADYVTNLVTYWPGSTLPLAITGWSRNWVKMSLNRPPEELKQYTNGFKVWTFTASDDVVIGAVRLPRRVTLEAFVPKPPSTATTGEDTEAMRKITFIAHSIEEDNGKFDPLPPVAVPKLSIIDRRFEGSISNFIVVSYATSNGWPTFLSKGYNQAAADAREIALDNNLLVESKSKKAQGSAIVILGINLVAILFLAKVILKRKLNKNQQ